MKSTIIKEAASFFGFSTYILGILTNIGNVNSFLLALGGLIFVYCKVYFFVVKQRQEAQRRAIEMEVAQLELDIKKRENKNKENEE